MINDIQWIDSHAHLCEDNFNDDIDNVILRAKAANIVRILVITCGLDQVDKALALKKRYPMIDLALGLHPEDADDVTDQMLEKLDRYLVSNEFIAVGEIGLDHYWRKDNKDKQRELFIAQIALANKHELPILVHSREASQDTYQTLKENPVKRNGIMHCYSGSVEMAKEYVKLGYYISLAGPLTFKNAVNPVEVAKGIDINNLFIETDSPFMAPVPMRGKRNEPAFVAHVGCKLAEVKDIDSLLLSKQMLKNYKDLFGVNV
ncbi:MAG: TatD family hydrolase [Erysipelotrichaceae bacterium]|nr:TatD family hydrolase [Erysipelotrichaceae bacterium]